VRTCGNRARSVGLGKIRISAEAAAKSNQICIFR